jgi:hypothetical protein
VDIDTVVVDQVVDLFVADQHLEDKGRDFERQMDKEIALLTYLPLVAGHDIAVDYKVLAEEPSLVVVVAAAAAVEIVLALAMMIHLQVGRLQAGHMDHMDLDLDIDVVEHFEVIVVRAVIVVMN